MLDSSEVHDRFNKVINDSPNELTLVIRCHHLIEKEINQALVQALPRSGHLDLKRLPFLTKVDLLIALGLVQSELFSLFEQANQLRNRFAHNPSAAFTKGVVDKIRQVISSQKKVISKKDFEWGDSPKRTVAILLNLVHIHARMGYETIVKQRAESYAADTILREKFPEIVGPNWQPKNADLFQDYERRAREYIKDTVPNEDLVEESIKPT